MRQKCGDKPKDLEEHEAEVIRFLGGTLDPISAVHELDGMTYHGSVERAMLRISELIPLAYPTLQTKADRQQMVLLHLQKLLPLAYQKELIKTGVTKLEEAVTILTGMERDDRSVQGASACVVGRVVKDTATNVPQTDRQCLVCGLTTHMKVRVRGEATSAPCAVRRETAGGLPQGETGRPTTTTCSTRTPSRRTCSSSSHRRSSMCSRVSQKNNFFEKYRCSGLIWFS